MILWGFRLKPNPDECKGGYNWACSGDAALCQFTSDTCFIYSASAVLLSKSHCYQCSFGRIYMFNTCTTEGILTIRKNLVCAGYFFEFFLSFLSVLRVLVWMPTQRQFAISNTRTDQLAAARLVTLMIYVYKCSGVARIWCQGGTKIEAPKARASRRQRRRVGWGMERGVRSPAD